jgi:hypothetical protein
VEPPHRLAIPGCIACGAMWRDATCPAACRECRLDLVSGGDYEDLSAAAAACRDRVEGLRAVVSELARSEPAAGEWRGAYEALRQSARSALRRFRPAAGAGEDDFLSPAETVTIWRCRDCGGIDAPQPCLDVCIWGPADWVDAISYQSKRSRAAADREAETSLAELLRGFAFATPRAGQWQRNLRAFQSMASRCLRAESERAGQVAEGVAEPEVLGVVHRAGDH